MNYRGKVFFILKQVLRFAVYSNLFITACCIVMAYHTAALFSLPFSFSSALFIISGTLVSYSFHWMLPPAHRELSPRDVWSRNNRFILFTLFFAGMAGALFSAVNLTEFLPKLFPVVILTFLYSSGRLPKGPFKYFRKYFIGKTIYLALMWSLVTVYLPVVFGSGGWSNELIIFLAGRFFFLFAICILFDLRDKQADTNLGIKSLITLLSYQKIKILFFFSIIASAVFYSVLLSYGIHLRDVIILIVPSAAAALSYRKSTATRHDAWFYLYLDGLMMASGLICIIDRILINY